MSKIQDQQTVRSDSELKMQRALVEIGRKMNDLDNRMTQVPRLTQIQWVFFPISTLWTHLLTPQIKDVGLFQVLESISIHLTNNCMHATATVDG